MSEMSGVECPQQEVTRLRDDLVRAERHRGEQELGRRREASRTACRRNRPFIWRRHSLFCFGARSPAPDWTCMQFELRGIWRPCFRPPKKRNEVTGNPRPTVSRGDAMSQERVRFDGRGGAAYD
jgi:hypothetical protein